MLGQYPKSIENNPFVPLELTPGFNFDADDIWPRHPKIYPDFLAPPPDWRTCERPEITHYLPGLKGTLKTRTNLTKFVLSHFNHCMYGAT